MFYEKTRKYTRFFENNVIFYILDVIVIYKK